MACVRPPLGRAPVPPLGLPIQSTTSTIFYFYHYCWKYIMFTNTKTTSAFYFLRKVFILDPTISTAVHCTIWANFSVGPTIWERCTCWTDFIGISMPSSVGDCQPSSAEKKKCLPGFHSVIIVAAVEWNWNKINSMPKSISSNAFDWIHAIIRILQKILLFHVASSSFAVNSCQHGHNYFTSCHPKQSGSDDRCVHLYLQLPVHHHLQ